MTAFEDARHSLEPWRAELLANRYEVDTHLQSLLAHYGRSRISHELHALGAEVSGRLDALARETNLEVNLPRLRTWDGLGQRVEAIDFHPGYHELGREIYGTGAMSLYAEAGHELESLALHYLYSTNGEAGHACPMACTAGLIKILQEDGKAPPEWLERLLDPDYDEHWHGAQFLTEVQGGSDVGANACEAVPAEDGGAWISGEKWFCSVIDAQLFLVTARPRGAVGGTRGLAAYAVPRHLEDGRPNGLHIRRLKDKLGTRSMASAEVDFDRAWGWPVGQFKRVLEQVLDTSRMYNAAATSGMLQRAFLEARAYARHRRAFGQSVLDFPAVARIVARLRVDAYAARASTFLTAHLSDRVRSGAASLDEAYAWRMMVNLDKYWTAVRCTLGVRDAIEVLGGNGAIEEFTVLPRLLRDAIVCEQWEGTHNVLCAQVLRDSLRYQMHEPLFNWLEELAGPHPRLTQARRRWERVLALPADQAAAHIRDAVDLLRPAVQAQALRAELAGGGTDPDLPLVLDHLLATTRPGWDPLDDEGLMDRVERLVR